MAGKKKGRKRSNKVKVSFTSVGKGCKLRKVVAKSGKTYYYDVQGKLVKTGGAIKKRKKPSKKAYAKYSL